MRTLILIIILLAIDYYAFQAVRTIIQNYPRNNKTFAIVTYVAVSAFCYLYMLGAFAHLIESQQGRQAVTYLRAAVFILFISKFLIGLFVAIDDVRRLFTYLYSTVTTYPAYDSSRSRFLAQLGLTAGAIPFVSLLYGMWRNPYRYKVHKHQVSVNNLPNQLRGFKIVQISDIHSGTFNFQAPIINGIDIINDLNPDLVCFTGDLVNSEAREMEPFVDIFDKIKAKYGIYSVLGNHDYGDYKQWESTGEKEENFLQLLATHKRLGWDLLRNEHRVIDVDGAKLAIIGVENSSATPRFQNYGDMQKAVKGTETIDTKILLSHDPSHWNAEVTKDYKNIALTMAGHTHGFQFGIEIPGWIKWSPSKYVYKQWAGLYQEDSQFLYVNRGFGMLGYPGRVGILPEITCIELVPSATSTI